MVELSTRLGAPFSQPMLGDGSSVVTSASNVFDWIKLRSRLVRSKLMIMVMIKKRVMKRLMKV